MARVRTNRPATLVADIAEVTVRYPVVGISVAGHIENVEEVGPDAEHMLLAPDVEVLEQGSVDLTIARTAFGVVVRGTKGIGSRNTVRTDSIVCPSWI